MAAFFLAGGNINGLASLQSSLVTYQRRVKRVYAHRCRDHTSQPCPQSSRDATGLSPQTPSAAALGELCHLEGQVGRLGLENYPTPSFRRGSGPLFLDECQIIKSFSL